MFRRLGLVLVAVILVGACQARRSCGCEPSRFHGAAGIHIAAGREAMWWTDPLAESVPHGIVITVPTDAVFDIDQAVLGPSASTAINKAIEAGAAAAGSAVLVDCYADATGTDVHNQRLSDARAAALAAGLADAGVMADVITRTGHGEADPIADNATPTGRALNRRCSITVLASSRTSA